MGYGLMPDKTPNNESNGAEKESNDKGLNACDDGPEVDSSFETISDEATSPESPENLPTDLGSTSEPSSGEMPALPDMDTADTSPDTGDASSDITDTSSDITDATSASPGGEFVQQPIDENSLNVDSSSRIPRPNTTNPLPQFPFVSLSDERHKQEFMRLFPKERPDDLYPYVNDEEFAKAKEALDEKRLLLVTCAAADLLLSLIYDFAREYEQYEIWEYLAKSNEDGCSEAYQFDQIIEWTATLQSPALCIVDVAEGLMFDSMFKFLRQNDFAHRYASNDNARLVCRLSPDRFDFQPRAKIFEKEWFDGHVHRNLRGFAFWKVPFELPLLSRHAPADDKHSPRDLNERLQEQRQKWPADERDYYDELMRFLPKGSELVNQVIDEINARPASFEEDFENLERGNLVKKAVLFTAAYFPKLPLRDFELLVRVSIHGETVRVRRRIRTPVVSTGDSEDSSDTPQQAAQYEYERISALEYWNARGDQLLRRAHLKTHGTMGEKRYVDFAMRGYASLARDYVCCAFSETMPRFYMKQFEKIFESGILFSPQITKEISDKLAVIAADMVAVHPAEFGASWLIRVVHGIRNWNPEVRVTRDELATVPREILLIAKFAEFAAEKDGKTSFFYARLEELCRQLQMRPECRSVLNQFLDRLLKEPENARDLLRIAKRLKPIADFDYFNWLRRVMKVASGTVRLEIYSDLIRDAAESPDQFLSTAEKLKEWHPAEGKSDIQADEKYALAFLWDFFVFTRHAFQTSSKYRHLHPFFPANAPAGWTDFVHDWVVHPAFATGVQFVIKDQLKQQKTGERFSFEGRAFDLSVLLGELFEGWTEIADTLLADEIDGADADTFSSNCDATISRIIRSLSQGDQVDALSISCIKNLKSYLLRKAAGYLELMRELGQGEIAPNTKAMRKELKAKRTRLRQLHAVVSKTSKQSM